MTDQLAAADSAASSKLAVRAGWALTALFTLFMIFDVVIKLIRMPIVEETLNQLGYPAGAGFAIGVLEAIVLALYLVPRTSVLGAVLFTGVFGGAIASHWRVGSPLISHVLFGVYLGLFAWGGLWLRDARLRALFPLRAP
jgi:DoxX-like family